MHRRLPKTLTAVSSTRKSCSWERSTKRINGKTSPALVTRMHLPWPRTFFFPTCSVGQPKYRGQLPQNSELPSAHIFFKWQLLYRPKPQLPFLKLFFEQTNARTERTAEPFPIFLEMVAENKSTWSSAARDVAKCIKKIARIRWKRSIVSPDFTMVWREVRAGLNYSLVQWNWFSGITECTCIQWRQRTNFIAPGCMCNALRKRKKKLSAFGCRNPSKCRVSIWAPHTDRYTVKTRSTVQ